MAKKSTIVPGLLRRTFGTLERVRPDWSARLAEPLWFRSGQPASRATRERRSIPGGTPFTVRLHGSEIRGVSYGPPTAPLAYLIHGWGGWWQQLSSFVPILTNRGYRVVAFDALAHGDSGPGRFGRRSSSVPEMAEAYHAVATRFGTPAVTVAHSVGCLSVVWAQRHHDIAPERQVLIAPAATTEGMLDIFTATLGVGEPTRTRLVERFATRMGRPLTDFDLLPLVAAEQADRHLPPALIVHDRTDRMTSPLESERLAAAWPNSDLLLTEGQGHYRVLREAEVLARTADFVGTAPGAIG